MTAAPDRLSTEQLRELAEDAQEVLWWAFRMRMPKQQQVDETVKAFEVRLGYRNPVEASEKRA